MDEDNKHKYDFLLTLLSEGDAMVCLDARNPEVQVPKAYKNDPSLNLIFNLNFKRPIDINRDGIFVTLSFNGRPHKCVIPFDSVWAIYEPLMKKGQVWEDSLPRDINLAEQKIHKSPPKKELKGIPLKPEKSPGAPPPVLSTKKDRSHLRVIK
ncbi:MAG: ClpXP protease specificity-enhancing factor SspB [Nitrospinaceae bacterium]